MDGLPQPSLNFAYASLPITVCLFESRRLLTVELKSSNMIGKQHCIVHFLNAAMLRGSMLASFLASKSAPAGTNCSAAQQSKAPSVLALILPAARQVVQPQTNLHVLSRGDCHLLLLNTELQTSS